MINEKNPLTSFVEDSRRLWIRLGRLGKKTQRHSSPRTVICLVVVVLLFIFIVPVAKAFGVDPLHLGIIFLTNLEIGYSTPPVGINLFISSFRFDKPVLKLYAAALPFLGILLIALLIITYFPDLSLYLVKLSAVKSSATAL